MNLKLLLCLTLLAVSPWSCSTTRSPESIDARLPRQPQTTFEHAKNFDAFVNRQLSEEESVRLIEQCTQSSKFNIFCSSILNFEMLEEKYRKNKTPKKTTRSIPISPKFRAGKLQNWMDLKFATIGSTIRGISFINENELDRLKAIALQEMTCPNNAAVGIAARLEDFLPQADAEEIAKLYFLAGDCLIKNPAERESLVTRAGLFYFLKGNFEAARNAFLISSSIEGIYTGRAQYWLYRSYVSLKDEESAEAQLKKLKGRYPFSFHTLVALTSRNEDPGAILLRSRPLTIKRSQQFPTANVLIEQAEELIRFGFKQTASRVLDWAILEGQGAEPEVKVYLAELKKDQGDYLSKMTLLSEVLYKNPDLISRETMELYFPKVFFPVFQENTSGIDPYLLLAIARQESAFNARAVSSANARGLLQVLPKTARRRRFRNDLLDPNINVRVGSRYVQDLMTRTNGQIHLALAAYNAGPTPLSRWTTRYPLDEPILFIDLIPYRETRDYVASVLRNYYWYRRIHETESNKLPKNIFDVEKRDAATVDH